MERLAGVPDALRAANVRLFTVGQNDVTVLELCALVVAIGTLFVVAGRLKAWIAGTALARSRLEPGARHAVGVMVRYIVLVAGVMIIMQTAGINLTTFNVLAGAVGVGIGFGLQDIVKNFISGLIIMFDRPIHIGDRIEIAGVHGEVVDIGARRITMTTPEGMTIVVPNAKFVTESVKNHHSPYTAAAQRIAINVSRDSDPRLARRIIYEVAAENPRVEREPAPFVRLNMPTGSAFPFELRFWSRQTDPERDELLNELHYALHEKFSSAGVKLV
jgi:small-conductance mechanosensitive channel